MMSIPDKRALLFSASRDGTLGLVVFLVDNGVKIDAECDSGETPLLLAAEKKHRHIVEYLIRAGADVNCARAGTRYTPLHYATEYKWIDIVETLLKKGADVHAMDCSGLTPIHLAAKIGHKDILALLKNAGADIDAKGISGGTPLLLAAERRNKNIVEHLISAGADVNCSERECKTSVLHYIVEYGWFDMVEPLVRKGADLNCKDDHGNTPVLLAAIQAKRYVVKYLINAGADISHSGGGEKFTLLHYASRNGWLDIVESLLEKGANINARTKHRHTPLNLAAKGKNKDIVVLLINAGANIHFTGGKNKQTVLHYAVRNKWLDITQSLLEKGADIDAKDFEDCTPLLVAASNDAKNIVECLINAEADLNISGGNKGFTILHYASKNGWSDIVVSLLKRDAKIDKKSCKGQTPLQIAFIHNKKEIAYHLINAGAYVSVKWKCIYKSPGIARFLIQNGKYFDLNDYVRFFGCCVLKTNIVRDVQLCTQAIINEFNHKDLPRLYKLPMVRKNLLPIEKMRILYVSNHRQMSQVTRDIMKRVKYEIYLKGSCNFFLASPIVLKMLTVKSFLNYWDTIQRQHQIKRADELNLVNQQLKLARIS